MYMIMRKVSGKFMRIITERIAIKVLQHLIEKRQKRLDITPAFLEGERNALEAEIMMYQKHLEKIKGR